MWKVLLMISAVVLIGSGVFSYMNKSTLESSRTEREQNQKDLEKSLAELAKKEENLKMTLAEAEKLKAEAESLKTEFAQAKLKESNGALEITNLTAEQKTASEALANAQEFLDKVPNIKKLKEEMAERSSQIQEAEIAIASTKGQVSAAEERRQRLDKQRAEMQAVVDDRNRGLIRGEFATTVKKAFNNWGFVVIDAGDNEGVVNKAQLDVLRRGQPICKLLVTAVEPGESVAEVISGSLQPGQSIQEGDVVTKSTTLIPDLIPASARPAPPTGGGAADPAGLLPPAGDDSGGMGAPAGGAGGDPDPFAPAAPAGGMGGGMGGGAEPDPFAPAAPAPAPAGDGAMDGGAAEPDPFAPAAPAGGDAKPPAGDADPFQ